MASFSLMRRLLPDSAEGPSTHGLSLCRSSSAVDCISASRPAAGEKTEVLPSFENIRTHQFCGASVLYCEFSTLFPGTSQDVQSQNRAWRLQECGILQQLQKSVAIVTYSRFANMHLLTFACGRTESQGAKLPKVPAVRILCKRDPAFCSLILLAESDLARHDSMSTT